MSSVVTIQHNKVVRPNISMLLKDNNELAEYVAELEADNEFLRHVVDEQRARIMELTYIGGYIEVSHGVNYKNSPKPRELKTSSRTRNTADTYRKIYKIYHKQLLNDGWPRIELTNQDIAVIRRSSIEQAITENIYTPGNSHKSKAGYKKSKSKISKDILRVIMPSPYKVHPDIILGDKDYHFLVLLENKGCKQKKMSAG